MEIFKTDILKREFERFQKEDLIEILQCGYCQKTACQSFHKKFLVSCKFCRETFCKKCHKFDTTKEILLKEVDEIGKDYIENFIKDFLNIRDRTLEANYKVEIERVPIEKNFKVKSYTKSNKNRSQVINKTLNNCEKINYKLAGKQRTLYKKF